MDNGSKTYSLTIEGGNKIFVAQNLTLNGTNYVSETQIDTANWPEVFKLTAKDKEGKVTEEFAYAKLLQQVQYDWDGGKFYLAFAPISEQEIKNAEFQAQLEYMAMMTDIDIYK